MALGNSPVDAITGLEVWGPMVGAGDSEAAWTKAEVDCDAIAVFGGNCLMLELTCDGTGSPAEDCFVRIKWNNLAPPGEVTDHPGGVLGRWADATHADRALTIASILSDCGTKAGATVIRVSGLTTVLTQFVARYPSTIPEVITQATLMTSAPIETYFDLDLNGADRFTANTRPTEVDLTRNRFWSVDTSSGESLEGLEHDWESTPEQVEVIYAVRDDVPYEGDPLHDGLLKSVRYPPDVEVEPTEFPLIESIDLSGEPPCIEEDALAYARAVYEVRQQNAYSGDVILRHTALTASGQSVPTVFLRPGDRLGIPSRSDVPVEGLYVQSTSYDFSAGTCTATVGYPWDVAEYESARINPMLKRHRTQHGGVDRTRRRGAT
jgi:hypothetical protein